MKFLNDIAPCGSWLASDSYSSDNLNPAAMVKHAKSPSLLNTQPQPDHESPQINFQVITLLCRGW
ncbi:hypothetical protein [Pseudomonas sp. MF6776]|uniref:hypothetical protein n=1 Tax=Pseudomonas sp. MF6776 TaxID=2797534 RepID=UPI001909EBAA|nr:hypothetical protein [Pseudomonas sp. MF6776]MBK3466609.1 hypothetical protein [Pseudomonas sp. MF6776]